MTVQGKLPLQPENVQTFPRPPRVESVPHVLRVELAGHTVAETNGAMRVLETHHAPTYYFPPEDVSADLIPVANRTFCEWKGVAQYFDVAVPGQTAQQAAWCYEAPSSTFSALAGYVAFYAGLMSACYVGSVRVLPQPGDFYGGWVTPNLTGQIKGGPGTRHW